MIACMVNLRVGRASIICGFLRNQIIRGASLMAQDTSHAVVVGGGIMGGDITIMFAANGWNVQVMSPSAKTREALPARIAAGLKKLGADANAGKVTTHA